MQELYTQKPIILAVDDQPAILHMVASELSELYQVRPFTSGQTALKYLTTQSADLILLDIDMPDMDGFDLASIIRAFEKHRKTPILFLTGNAIKENVITAVQSGGNDFITKPVERDILLAKIAKYLPQK